MFKKTYHATHPDSIQGADNETLRDRYLIGDLFVDDDIVLNYTHYERFVVGGAAPVGKAVALPAQTEPASAKGKPFLERRELGVINVGDGSGTVTVDGETFKLQRAMVCTCRWEVPRCVSRATMRRHVRASTSSLRRRMRASPPSTYRSTRPCRSSAAPWKRRTRARSTSTSCRQRASRRSCCWGLTILKPGSVWNTMPPHLHDRRSEVYFYFGLPADQRVMHSGGALGRAVGSRRRRGLHPLRTTCMVPCCRSMVAGSRASFFA